MTQKYKRIVYDGVSADRINYRICYNPDYGGKSCSVPGTCRIRIRTGKKSIKPKTRERIRQSIEREGFRNPIVVYNTPEGMLLGFGGGRLQAAKEMGGLIPAIIIDYTGDFEHHTTEVTKDNWQTFFKDVPKHFVFHDRGIETHYNLERVREGEPDEAGLSWADGDDLEAIYEESPWLQ